VSAIGKRGNRPVVPGRARLEKLSKARLIELILEEREATRLRLEAKEKRIAELSEALARVQREHDGQSNGRRIRDINQQVNEPSSKKPEWDKDGNPRPPKSRRKQKRKKRPGCGNGSKFHVVADETNDIPLDACPCCGRDLQDKQGRKRPGRRVEDIATAGISKIMIRLSAILQPVYDEILEDLRGGTRIWADETGWRVRGKLWWL